MGDHEQAWMKSDRLDAEQIARAVLGQTSTATPKLKSGLIEVIRTLCVTRRSAVKARTQTFNTLFGIMIGPHRRCATNSST
jgi:transposase